jgi:hypothetical protein
MVVHDPMPETDEKAQLNKLDEHGQPPHPKPLFNGLPNSLRAQSLATSAGWS